MVYRPRRLRGYGRPAGHSIRRSSANGAVTANLLTQARGEICAAALQDGRALLTGGQVQNTSSNASELYQLDSSGTAHQVAGTSATAPKMLTGRVYHTCTVLQDGSVLITGGLRGQWGGADADSIEIYTPFPLNPM